MEAVSSRLRGRPSEQGLTGLAEPQYTTLRQIMRAKMTTENPKGNRMGLPTGTVPLPLP